MTGNQSPSPPPAPSGTGDTVRGPGCSLIAATLASRRPVRIRAGSDWLPSWYASHCDGDREHEGGVTIKTLDNPGWAVKMIPPYAHAPDRSDAGQRGMGNRPHSKSQHRAVQGRAGQHREGRQGRVAVPVAPTMLRTRPSRPVRRPLSSWGRPPTSGARSGRGGGGGVGVAVELADIADEVVVVVQVNVVGVRQPSSAAGYREEYRPSDSRGRIALHAARKEWIRRPPGPPGRGCGAGRGLRICATDTAVPPLPLSGR
ncbi:Imm53 family immunity protein [Streptomyces caniferus]|uniref:Imm53 family immunity protein n=1 Tax=Streptomyces caniferus TaxID=285557 RepID=UPI001FE8370A|nr:Imm53 family immunity protein [Streptomyces caniferus]